MWFPYKILFGIPIVKLEFPVAKKIYPNVEAFIETTRKLIGEFIYNIVKKVFFNSLCGVFKSVLSSYFAKFKINF